MDKKGNYTDMKNQRINIRSFEETDIILFQKWLMEPHVAKYYHDPSDWLDEVVKRETEFSWITHCIVEQGGIPFGFCQYYPYEKSIFYGENWHGSVPIMNTYSIDYMIGELSYIGKGYGREIVLELVKRIFEIPNAERIIVQPEVDNLPSCRTLLSAGFHYDKDNQLYLYQKNKETGEKSL